MPYNIGYRTVYYIGEPEHEKLTGLKTTTGAPVKYSDIITKYNASNKFTDNDFPPNEQSVDIENFSIDSANTGLDISNWDKTVLWKRPKEALELTLPADSDPIGEVMYQINNPGESFKKSRFDVQQGQVGDCWFIAGVAQITVAPELIEIVVPNDNEQNNDSGAYHFRMWKFGVCTDVVIDDYLPLYEPNGPGSGYQFLLGAPKQVILTGDYEFWGCLVEKAYAKLNGNIARLSGNQPRYGLEDLTGGISETMPLEGEAFNAENIFGTLSRLSGITFVNFATDGTDDEGQGILSGKNAEEGKAYGLARPHAYSMTKVATVKYNGQDVKLVCLRNPWGTGEWTGPWNENSDEWNSVSEEDKKAVGLVKNDDSEFRLTWDDAQKYYAQLDICYWIPEALVEPLQKVFILQQHHSKWCEADGTNAGWDDPSGNPQYVVEVKVDNGAIIASLEAKAIINDRDVSVGVNCYKIANPSKYDLKKPLGSDFFEDAENTKCNSQEEECGVAGGDPEGDMRIGRSWKVPAGTYVLVPKLCTDGIRDLDFALRIAGQISNEKQQLKGEPTVIPPPPAPPTVTFNWDDALEGDAINLTQDQLNDLNQTVGGDTAAQSNFLGNYGGKHLPEDGAKIEMVYL